MVVISLKKKLLYAVLVIIAGVGLYLIFTSEEFNIDFYSLVLTLLVGGIVVYLYLVYRGRE
ncbi:MAG: hypothetical protein SVV67_02785 [Bacillota bacterium]|nr:hypothetical protein [Bacillota bacterium]